MKKFGRKLIKICKFLFSKYLIFALILAAQIVVIQISYYYISSYLLFLNIFLWVLTVIVFLHIVNKKEEPEFKLSWTVVILLLPLVGILAYVFFKNHGMRKKHAKIMTEIDDKIAPYFVYEHEELNKAVNYLNDYYGSFKFIEKQSHYKIYNNCKIKYFKSGEEYFDDIIETMKFAREYIFIEFFIINNHGQLWDRFYNVLKQKAEEGLDIRILFDDVGSAGNMNYLYLKELRKLGIKVFAFNKFIPIMSSSFNNRDHRKIVIIDHIAAYTGGNNLADEYANIITRFGHWKDTGVKIEGAAINNFLALFLQLYDLESKTVSDYDKYLNYDYEKYREHGYIIPFGDGPRPFYREFIGEGNFLNMINNAKKSIYISSPYFIPTHSLVHAIRLASYRGVTIKLMLPGIPDKKLPYKLAQSYFKSLVDAGVEIYLYKPGFNHNKCVVVDEILAFNGTINFDYRSLVHHFECGVLMYDTNCIDDIVKDFNETFDKCERVVNPKASKNLLVSIANIFAPLF